MNRRKCESCPVCKSKLLSKSFEAPECPKCQTVFPNIFRQILPELNKGSRINLLFIHHVHLDETPLPSIIFQKLLESKTVEDLTFRRGREHSEHVLSVETCKYIGLLLQQQPKLWHFAFDCPVDPEGLRFISHGLSVNQTLQEVDVSFGSVQEAEQLGKGIAANKSIKKLGVSGNHCPSEGVLKLFEELKECPSLVEVKLENMRTSGQILFGLKYLPSPRLKLSNIQLSSSTDTSAIEGLKHCKCLELEIANSLDFANVGLVMRGLAQNSSVKKLVIHQAGGLISNEAASHVAEMLQQNRTLTELSISSREEYRYYNYIQSPKVDRGFQSICKALLHNNTLTSLDLDHCSIRDDLSALGDVLLHNRTLKAINLSRSFLATQGDLEKFCESLKVNATLHTLNLAHCQLSREAMLKMSAALRVNKSLTAIDLSYHSPDFTDALYPKLCDAIKSNSSLKKVVLGTDYALDHFQHHDTVALSSIADIIKCNANISTLHVTHDLCRFPPHSSVMEFVEALKVNKTLTSLKLGSFMREKQSTKHLADIFASNYWLLDADFCNGAELCKHLKRNLDYRKRTIANTMVLCENIFRSEEAMNLLPPELWMNVFAQLTYPGIGSMAPLIEQFTKYRNSKLQ